MNLKIILPAVCFFSLILLVSGCDRPAGINQGGDGLPPAVPVGLNIYFARDGEVLIEWQRNNEPDLKGYNVYKTTGNGNFINTAFTGENYFFDDSLNYDSTYYYAVTAVDFWDTESALSQAITARPENKYPPDAPEGLSINARNWEGVRSIDLSWQPGIESDVAGYYIYRSSFSTFTADSTNLMGYCEKEKWLDTVNLSLLTMYYYKIQAADKGGLISTESAEVSDKILKTPEVVSPADDEELLFYGNFKFKASGAPAAYKIVVQSNSILGTLWEKQVYSSSADDTIEVRFDYPYVEENKEYYWRAASYSVSTEPNSVTKLYKFKIRF